MKSTTLFLCTFGVQRRRLATTLLLALSLTLKAQLSSTNNISFQGVLNGSNGLPLPNGNYNLTFKFYDVPTGGVALYTSTIPDVVIVAGIASMPVQIDPSIFNGLTRFLGVTVNGGVELAPRILVTTVPYAASADNLRQAVFVGTNGNVGIGTRTPYSSVGHTPTLHIEGSSPGIKLRDIDPEDPACYEMYVRGRYFSIYNTGTGDTPFKLSPDGKFGLGFGAVWSPTGNATLEVNGMTRTSVLQITGGADLAEHVPLVAPNLDSKVEPGMVVSIDPTGSRKFKLSDEPYDRRRVGIISGGNGVKPGLLLQDEGNPAVGGDQPIALIGQVWCRADASFGSIIPGDLLTTSRTPGHAMRVSDERKARFAVLGQALTGLNKGRGWVQVLVGKQ